MVTRAALTVSRTCCHDVCGFGTEMDAAGSRPMTTTPSWDDRAGAVGDGVANLVDGAGQAGVGDERAGPHPVEDFGLRHRPWAGHRQEHQDVEGLGSEVNGFLTARHRARVDIDGRRGELDEH
jgi:hypothetical protein